MVVPIPQQEDARGLVPAREDARRDLMRDRHRVSKLPLREGIVFSGQAWTGAHEAWLVFHRFARPGVRLPSMPRSPSRSRSATGTGSPASTIGSFVELVPSEFTLGQYRVQGPITKTGNGHARWVAFTQRRKRLVVANVAVARELAGWCWSLAVMDE